MLKKLLFLGILIMNSYGNELKHEESPYLQQHADNPVYWYAWGDKALDKAKKENKLIFLSIGYSTCHWCHVMEHESFENEAIAKLLNDDYVSIKVDREEYPNIDKYYQEIYRMMNNRSGGWPLTVIMTPDAKVFFTATYLPPEPKYNYKGLNQILPEVHDLYLQKRDKVVESANYIISEKERISLVKEGNDTSVIDLNISAIFVEQVKLNYDTVYKGVGSRPKFPHATTLDSLLDVARLTLSYEAKDMALDALIAMAKGGINDQIEGGFYRYSTDEQWMIPHFEKMLYTNAELLEAYANAYVMTKEPFYKKVITETIENIYRRFEKENLFYSASDADSDKVEGKYFVFEYEESFGALKKAGFSETQSEKALVYFNISEDGNFEDEKSNPYLTTHKEPSELEKMREVLLNIRAKRNYPFIDNKIQTSWNALFIHALFKAGEGKKALNALDALVENLYVEEVLYHQKLIGKIPKVKAYLEDYSFLIASLIDAHQETLEHGYLELAQKLTNESIRKFYKKNQWFMSDDSFKAEADLYDASYRSAMAVMIENILKLSHLNDNYDDYLLATKMMNVHAKQINEMASNFPYALKVSLMLRYPLVVIKATKENLLAHKNMLSEVNYPYLLLKKEKSNNYSACTMKRCFATHKRLDTVLKEVEKIGN